MTHTTKMQKKPTKVNITLTAHKGVFYAYPYLSILFRNEIYIYIFWCSVSFPLHLISFYTVLKYSMIFQTSKQIVGLFTHDWLSRLVFCFMTRATNSWLTVRGRGFGRAQRMVACFNVSFSNPFILDKKTLWKVWYKAKF